VTLPFMPPVAEAGECDLDLGVEGHPGACADSSSSQSAKW